MIKFQVLRAAVYKCLSRASNSSYTTIAIPGLGSGQLGYHRDIVAKVTSSAVKYLRSKHPSSSLREVICVIHPSNAQLIEAFKKMFKDKSAGLFFLLRTVQQVIWEGWVCNCGYIGGERRLPQFFTPPNQTSAETEPVVPFVVPEHSTLGLVE